MANGYSKFWSLRACLEGLIVKTSGVKDVTSNSMAVDMAIQIAADFTSRYTAFGIIFKSHNAVSYSIAGYTGPLVANLGVQGFANIHNLIAEVDGYVARLNNLPTQTDAYPFPNPAGVQAYYQTIWPILKAELQSVAAAIGA